MSATTTTVTETTTTVPTPIETTAAAAEQTIAASSAKAIAFASTFVTSLLDALEGLHVKARGAASAGLDYGDTVGRNVSAASRKFVDKVDAATVTGLAKARTFAVEKLARAKGDAPVASA